MLKLIKEGDSHLTKSLEDWDFEKSSNAEDIEKQMLEFMKEHRGIGLAANQVGLDKRLFVMRKADGSELGCFNPSIIRGETEETAEEGCLSFPNLWLKIPRYKKILARYLDNTGKECIIELEGIDARCFQHELDHLNGVTFTKYVSDLKLKMARKKQRKLNG